MERQFITIERPAKRVARIILDRRDMGNAQNTQLLYELNDAFHEAAHDDDTSVIILAARGDNFSTGHDITEYGYKNNIDKYIKVGGWSGFHGQGAEALYAREREIYLDFCQRWRNIPKPTIAEVRGLAISGALMLIWPCDIIVAASDAKFKDNTVELGVGGIEYFAHVSELGLRKAKEYLFTADWITAEEAYRLGMVNHVVDPETLTTETLALAERIAKKPLFALKLAKEAANCVEDAQGREAAMKNAFHLHHLAHNHNMMVYGLPMDPSGMPDGIRKKIATYVEAASEKR